MSTTFISKIGPEILPKEVGGNLVLGFMVCTDIWCCLPDKYICIYGHNPPDDTIISTFRGEWILTVSFFSPPMKERKFIAEASESIWIWIIHATIAKWLNCTIKLNLTSWYYVQPRYRPQKNEKCPFWRVIAKTDSSVLRK